METGIGIFSFRINEKPQFYDIFTSGRRRRPNSFHPCLGLLAVWCESSIRKRHDIHRLLKGKESNLNVS
jgi:hypothetical protein